MEIYSDWAKLQGLPRDKGARSLGFKVDDKFVVLDTGNSNFPQKGEVITLVSDDYSDNPNFQGSQGNYCCCLWRLAKLPENNQSNSTMSNTIQAFKDLFVQEPQKSFRKAGITGNDDMLTEEGTQVFLTWLLSENATKFKTEVVDKMLAAQEEKKA